MSASWWHYLVGYGFAMVVPRVPPQIIRAVGDQLWAAAGGKPQDRSSDFPAIVGFLEGGLYTTAYLLGHADFIGVWLLLKVAGGWKGWESGHGGVNGRTLFQTVLVGMALSLAYGVLGAQIVLWLNAGECALAIAAPIALVTVNGIIWFWAYQLAKKRRPGSAK